MFIFCRAQCPGQCLLSLSSCSLLWPAVTGRTRIPSLYDQHLSRGVASHLRCLIPATENLKSILLRVTHAYQPYYLSVRNSWEPPSAHAHQICHTLGKKISPPLSTATLRTSGIGQYTKGLALDTEVMLYIRCIHVLVTGLLIHSS